MGRKRKLLEITTDDRKAIDHHIITTQDVRELERLNFAIEASTGNHTLHDLARHAGRSRSTIQNWLVKFARGGLRELLNRETAPGKSSPLADRKIWSEIMLGLHQGRWSNAQQIADWLKEHHGIDRNRKSIYYWMRKFSTAQMAK